MRFLGKLFRRREGVYGKTSKKNEKWTTICENIHIKREIFEGMKIFKEEGKTLMRKDSFFKLCVLSFDCWFLETPLL